MFSFLTTDWDNGGMRFNASLTCLWFKVCSIVVIAKTLIEIEDEIFLYKAINKCTNVGCIVQSSISISCIFKWFQIIEKYWKTINLHQGKLYPIMMFTFILLFLTCKNFNIRKLHLKKFEYCECLIDLGLRFIYDGFIYLFAFV